MIVALKTRSEESKTMSAPPLLEGIRILTLEQVHALPWGTAFLADLGAQVIRIESVEHLQDRKAGPFVNGKPGPEWWNEGANLAYFGTRNKHSLCLQVATPAGRDVFLKLVKNCDIVTDNFRPGTMRRYGFDHESLAQINPRIITLSSTAFGHTGPWSRAGSRARTVDSVCGMSYLTGFEGGPSQRASNNYMDHSTGNNVAYALLLALYRRNRTGKGLRIECRIPGADCNPYLAFAAALASGLDGIENRIEPPEHFSGDVYSAADLPRVPYTLAGAADRFEASAFAKRAFGTDVVEHYLHFFRTEQNAYNFAVTDWERRRYFERI